MFVSDKECTKDTPVIHGCPDKPIYGKGICLKAGMDGRCIHGRKEHFSKDIEMYN